MTRKRIFPILFAVLGLECAGIGHAQFFPNNSILGSLQNIITSTVPANGDLNPYGVAFVPNSFPSGGIISAGDVLVSNFNSSANFEGTGTTIVRVAPNGQQSLFATSTPIGLDTALGVLSRGFVVVGNLPVTYPPGTVPGAAGTIGAGSLQVFDRNGKFLSSITDPKLLDSPWDLTINDQGSTTSVFVSNVFSGTVTRVDLTVGSGGVTVMAKTQMGSNFGTMVIPAIVAVGPTGLAYDAPGDTLFVASTEDNEIFGIGQAGHRSSSAGKGFLAFSDPKHLHGPLGLTLAPNSDLIAANGDGVNAGGTQNELVEFTTQGTLVAVYQLNGGAAGAAFGIASTFTQGTVRFAAVDDDLNSLTIWTLRQPF